MKWQFSTAKNTEVGSFNTWKTDAVTDLIKDSILGNFEWSIQTGRISWL